MNATIQEIEGIDDYWGPAFRSVYEGEGHEAFVQQLDERIVQHDKEIEKLCNFHYQNKKKRGRRPNKLRGVYEDQQEALQKSMSQYEDNNNHISKRRRIDPERLGGYINTFPEPGTQCEPSDPHNSSKYSNHNLSDENLEETSEMDISSDEFEEITEYHTLQQLKQENHQLMSKEPDSSTDDLRLYLHNRNRLTASVVYHQNLLISVEEAGNRMEQQSDYSSKDSADRQISTRDQRPVVKEVDVTSSDDLRSYLQSKLSDEQLGQDKSSYAEHYQRQSQHETIQYDGRHKHQVEHEREQRRSLTSKYKVGTRQYDDIRHEKGQSRRASAQHNKDQIRSLSTDHFRTQNRHEPIEYDRDQSRTLSSERTSTQSLPVAKQYEKHQSRRASAEHDKFQGSLSSERNGRLSRNANFEYNRGQRRHVASEQDRNQNRKADRQRVKSRPMSAEDNRSQNLPEYNERYVRPSRPSSSEHYTSRNLHENIESSQNPYSFKDHIRPRTSHGISERDGINGQRVFAHQLGGQSHHSAEYDSGDSYSRGESTERPKIRRRPSSTELNIRQSRPSSSENYKQSFRPIIEYYKDRNQEQARGSRRISIDCDRQSLSSHESTVFDRGQGQALAERRRISKSRPFSSERYQRKIQGATMEYQRRERSHTQSDKKGQSRPSFSKHYVRSGQSAEYTPGQNRSDSSEGHRCRSLPVSADNNIRQKRLSYSEFESQTCHKVFKAQKSRKDLKINECFSGERGFLLTDHISDVQTDLATADINASHNRSSVSADLQQDKNQAYPKRYQVDDQPLTSDNRQVSSETWIKQHPLMPETQRETYRKSPDREDLSRPLSTQRRPTLFEMCESTVAGQHNSAPGKLIKPNYEECPGTSSSVPCHSTSNRVTSSQFFQNEILEIELSHVERNDIEKRKSFDCPQKKPYTTELKSCCDGVTDASETVFISHTGTDISMDICTPRSNTPLSTTKPEEENATDDFSNIDLRSKLTKQLEASALLPVRGSSEPRDHSRESFAEMSSIHDIEKNRDSIETVIVDLDLKTDDVRQCITPEPFLKIELGYTSYDLISFESSMVIERHFGQDNKAPELKRLPESNVKCEPICHDTNSEIFSAVDKNIAQNRLLEEAPDSSKRHKFPSQSCETVTPSGFIKSEIKQDPDNDTLNTVVSTSETDLGANSSCGQNNEDKQGQATAESSPASSNAGSLNFSVRDVNSINLLLSGANIDPLNAVLNKTDECEDDHIKMDVSAVTGDSWYTPRKITTENYLDKQKKPSISALVNSCDPRLRPRINRNIEILNEQKTDVLGEIDVAKSEINIKSCNTVLATEHDFQTSIDCQNKNLKPEEEKKPIVPNLAGKCGKLMLDILKSSKDTCYSNMLQISPASPQIQDEQVFTSLKPIDIETQVANAIPIYDSANKNHNINDWIVVVNKVAAVCNWNDQQVVGYAIPKIMGNGFDSNISWIEWQEKLRTAFPPKLNYGKMLLNMLNTTAKVGDSLVEYYYEKKTLLDKCNITGEKAIECIIFGIEDESVRTILESLDFDNQDQLLSFLSNFKN